MKSRVYLDVCCYNRPFDNQADSIVRMETEAILAILSECEQGSCELWGSGAVTTEIERIPDRQKRQKALMAIDQITHWVEIDAAVVARATSYRRGGIKGFDALHLACAEKASVTLVTTDYQLIKRAKSVRVFGVKVMNPIRWLLGREGYEH